ncbi:MAG: hypothetical protein HYU60_00800 [Magnetospirillum sp.]|nr:hypothetical protein [Magnetospirillum sp.]
MFLRHFDDEQRRQLLILAFEMMVADGVVRNSERDVLEALKQELHVFQIDREEALMGVRLDVFTDHRSRIAAMLKLISIALVDQEYHERELKVMVRCGREFGLSIPEMKAITEWGRKHYQLVKEAEEMISAASPSSP